MSAFLDAIGNPSALHPAIAYLVFIFRPELDKRRMYVVKRRCG